MTSLGLVTMLRYMIKNAFKVVMRESVSDEVLEELPKGEFYMKVSLKERSKFKNPDFKFKLRHDPDKISTGTSTKYNNAVKNCK